MEEIEGRKVYIVTGNKSQTVNVCDSSNVEGQYDWKIRIEDNEKFVDYSMVNTQKQGTVENLIKYLISKHDGKLEPTNHDHEWIERARKVIETCINEFVQEFIEHPYLHRVEHSLHMRLYSILRSQPLFDKHYPMANGEIFTQPIHKEWPETYPRENNTKRKDDNKNTRRGNFDLVILSPVQIKKCPPALFDEGRLIPPFIIEMGLNYGEDHLDQDKEKLENSKVMYGFLIHLERNTSNTVLNEEYIESKEKYTKNNTIKVAYAKIDGNEKYTKMIKSTY